MIWSLLLQMNGGMGGWWPFAFLGPLVGLLIMGTIVYLLWSAISGDDAPSSRTAQTNDPTETLRERYARGEIDEEEFDERARTLRER